jgi:hypothetical protein
MMGAREITTALGGRWAGGKGMARCPVHDDRRASLSIRDGDSGVVWFTCFAACDRRDIAAELRRRGLLDQREVKKQKRRVKVRAHPFSDRALKLGAFAERESVRARNRRIERACRLDMIIDGVAAETIKEFRYG